MRREEKKAAAVRKLIELEVEAAAEALAQGTLDDVAVNVAKAINRGGELASIHWVDAMQEILAADHLSSQAKINRIATFVESVREDLGDKIRRYRLLRATAGEIVRTDERRKKRAKGGSR